jgi:quercetin dioxygenase-like cupin family protein
MHSCLKAHVLGRVIGAGVVALSPLIGSSQEAPLANVANPGVYKVLQENDQFRVVLATWKPGQRDEFHSHPASATYTLTPCKARLHGPGNKVLAEPEIQGGHALLQPPIASHSFENIGSSECQILIVERK